MSPTHPTRRPTDDAHLALGVHTGVRIQNPEELLDRMGEYCVLDSIVAIGETSVTPSQHVERWELDEQRAVVRAQMELAADHDLPVILHTPNPGTGSGVPDWDRNAGVREEHRAHSGTGRLRRQSRSRRGES